MCSILEIIGGHRRYHRSGLGGLGVAQKKDRRRQDVFFLRGVKTSAEGNANNTGDTSAAWKALIKQIDDINSKITKVTDPSNAPSCDVWQSRRRIELGKTWQIDG
jgi:hypothetical protein